MMPLTGADDYEAEPPEHPGISVLAAYTRKSGLADALQPRHDREPGIDY